jgi:hypothetical protein
LESRCAHQEKVVDPAKQKVAVLIVSFCRHNLHLTTTLKYTICFLHTLSAHTFCTRFLHAYALQTLALFSLEFFL